MKRISIVVVVALVASVFVGLAGIRSAWAGSSTQTTIFVDPAESSYFGRTISLSGSVFDNECITNCRHPQGHIDYYRATSAADFETTKVFLRSSDSLSFENTKTGTADPVPYCCLPVGTWLIKGFYVPDTTGWDPSSDVEDNNTVRPRPTTMDLTQSSTTSAPGQQVTFTATVTPFEDSGSIGPLDPSAPKPTGTVTFREDPDANTHIQYGTVGISQSGQASVSVSTLSVGTHHIKAVYNNDSNYESSFDSVDHTVAKVTTTNTLLVSPTLITYGDSVSMTAFVTPSGATGTVDFMDTNPAVPVSLGSAQLGGSPTSATLSTSSLDAGYYLVVADYGGDASHEGSVSNASGLNVNPADTTTGLAASPSTTRFGQQVTFTATVSGPGTLGGSVQFMDGSTSLGSPVTLSAGQAALDISTLAAGTHDITAEYVPDANHNASTSGALEYVVSKADTDLGLTTSGSPSQFGQPVTFTATPAVVPPGAGTPSGSVQFKSDGLNLGQPQPISNGSAALTLSALGGGTHTITAEYAGDDNFNGSSASISQTVTCDRVITGNQTSVTASSGSTCLTNADVRNITVPAGAKLSIVNSTVRGTITSRGGAALVTICGSHIGGNLRVNGASGFVLVGDPVDDGCAANTIDGTVTLSNNAGGLELAFNHIGGRVNVKGNHTSPEIEANTIGGNLACSGNSPAASDDGRSNSIGGRGIGECSRPGF
jgi:hypothetical protein